MKKRVMVSTVVAAVLAAVAPPVVQAQAGADPGATGPRGVVGSGLAVLDRVVENAEEIGLSTEQTSRLTSFREASVARATSAREILERARDEPENVTVAEVRDARRLLAEERGLVRDEIAATLTVQQMEAFRDATVDRRSRRQAFRSGFQGPRRGPVGVPPGRGRR